MLKVYGIDERGSVTAKRNKLVSFTHIGGAASGMIKSKAVMHKSVVQRLWGSVACNMDISGEDGFSPEELRDSLLRAGAAHKPTSYDFGGGETIGV